MEDKLLAIKNITVPDIGAEADVIEILVKPGDAIKLDTPLITLESDKATMEVPSSDEGIVQEIKVKVGDKVAQGNIILSVETGQAEVQQKPAAKKEAAKETAKETEKKVAPSQPISAPQIAKPDSSEPVIHTHGNEIHASPIVRKIAREFGIDLAKVPATGPKHRLLKEDIQAYVKNALAQASSGGSALPSAPNVDFSKFGEVEVQSLTRIKKVSGKNLHRNWLLVPHITQFGESDITELEAFRQAQKGVTEAQGIKLTPLVFIMKAVVGTLKAFPHFNASLDAQGENLILKKYFHIGVAVDTPDGLVVPVIRNVDQKGLLDLAKELSMVSEKARTKQLSPADMQGGCFSISSLGGIGGTAFTPIVNLPEVAILGVSKSYHKPVYQDGTFVPRLILPLSLSYDHRVIDGADGARFMVYLSSALSDIRNLLL